MLSFASLVALSVDMLVFKPETSRILAAISLFRFNSNVLSLASLVALSVDMLVFKPEISRILVAISLFRFNSNVLSFASLNLQTS